MPNITSVTLTAGVPTAGTGTVGTLDNVTGTAGVPSVPVLTVQGVASGTAQPVSGTVAATQSGTWTVQPGNTANTTAWKVDGSAVTQPVSLASTTVTGTVAVTESGTWTVQPGNTANTTPWLAKVSDGTNAAAIKAASVSPVATDPALVVSLSPNSVNANGQAVMASSAPVVIASNQSAVPVTMTSTTLTGNSAVNLAQVAGATTAVGSGVQATALRTTLATDSPGIVTLGQTTKSASVPVTMASDQGGVSVIPAGAVLVTASATGTTLATTATLAAAAAKTTYLCGFSIRANATAAATGNATVTGTITGTLNFTQWTAPLASGIGVTEPNISFPIPSSAVNTAIAVVSAAPGAGGTVSVTAWGYQL